jgi:ElaB/YqjD/DUF883 family membrane-anchored ribosome-binding protein
MAKAKETAEEIAEETAEAKSRFSAALDEAKAGAASFKDGKGGEMVANAKEYGEDAKQKAGELAVDGKAKASDAISSLGTIVGDTAAELDNRFGEQYGDYARSASRSLKEASAKLDAKSVEEIGEDARDMVRKSPGVAVGVAAVAGFILARMLRR